MRSIFTLTIGLMGTLVSFPLHILLAQSPEGSMHGQPRVLTEANVRISVSSLAGTRREEREQVSEAITEAFAKVEQCYFDLLRTNPTLEGIIDTDVLIQNNRIRISSSTEGADAKLVDCIKKKLEGVRVTQRRSTGQGVRVNWNFKYSAAETTREIQTQAQGRPVSQDSEGHFVQLGNENVSFMLRSSTETGTRQYAQVLRDALPGFLDCRRKAARRRSPEGDIVITGTVGQGRIKLEVSQNSVADRRAGACVEQSVRRTLARTQPSRDVPPTFSIRLHFNP